MLPTHVTSIISFLCCSLIFSASFAQESADTESQSLNQQYNTLIDKSETFNEYKVIKKTVLTDFWKVVNDSIAVKENTRKATQTTLNAKIAQIEALNNTVQEKDNELATGEEEKSTLVVLGTRTNKSSYAILSVVIPFLLLIAIGFLVVKSKADTSSTKIAKQDLNDLEVEFENYKKKALDLQAKLNRELQTERNKLQEMKR